MSDNLQKLIEELRLETITQILIGLRTEPTPGWAQVARGVLNDHKDLLEGDIDSFDQDTLNQLADIQQQLKIAE